MLLACLPIDIVMRHRKASHRWDVDRWIPVAIRIPGIGELPAGDHFSSAPNAEKETVTRLDLTLYPDENEGYFENWAAPEPKVFVMWQMQGDVSVPLLASVSYAEGTRMLDSGDQSDGLAMPEVVYQWLAAYLKTHYRPKQQKQRAGHR
jgi:Protein of unknown function (DUF3305)